METTESRGEANIGIQKNPGCAWLGLGVCEDFPFGIKRSCNTKTEKKKGGGRPVYVCSLRSWRNATEVLLSYPIVPSWSHKQASSLCPSNAKVGEIFATDIAALFTFQCFVAVDFFGEGPRGGKREMG